MRRRRAEATTKTNRRIAKNLGNKGKNGEEYSEYPGWAFRSQNKMFFNVYFMEMMTRNETCLEGQPRTVRSWFRLFERSHMDAKAKTVRCEMDNDVSGRTLASTWWSLHREQKL